MMDTEYFINAGLTSPQPLEFETLAPMAWNGLNSEVEQSLLTHSYSVDQYSHFESSFSSLLSSPSASSSGLSTNAVVLHELIGKLGGGGCTRNSGVFPPSAATAMAVGGCHDININTNDSCYSDALSSPPKLNFPILDQTRASKLGYSVPLNPLPSFSTDPEFAERAAKFSCFGRWSFNGKTLPFAGVNNAGLLPGTSTPLMENGKLSRVSSSPSLKQDESLLRSQKLCQPRNETRVPSGELVSDSNEISTVSDQIPVAETGSKISNELNSRKRKPVSRGKSEDVSNLAKGFEGDDDANIKRSKSAESGKIENGGGKTEGEAIDENEKQKANQKPPEPPKDYIHVRARRGQATDSHSLAERVRREKISERMKLLQDLVPGCNKVTGKALMLDEIINYVQSLQRQVEFLSMKLASVNPALDCNMENVPKQMYPLDSSAPAFLNVHQLHNPTPTRQPSQNLSPGAFGFPEFGEGDLLSIFQMDQTCDVKVER